MSPGHGTLEFELKRLVTMFKVRRIGRQVVRAFQVADDANSLCGEGLRVANRAARSLGQRLPFVTVFLLLLWLLLWKVLLLDKCLLVTLVLKKVGRQEDVVRKFLGSETGGGRGRHNSGSSGVQEEAVDVGELQEWYQRHSSVPRSPLKEPKSEKVTK